MSTDLNIPDSTMSLRNHVASSIPVAIILAALALVVVPLFLTKQEVHAFNHWLPLLMTSGVIVAGVWGMFATAFMRDPMTGKLVAGRGIKVVLLLPVTFLASLASLMGAHYALVIGGEDQTSYHFHKTAPGVILGIVAVVAYTVMLQMFASGRVVRKAWWLIAFILLAVSIASPWLWSGIKVGVDNY